MLLALVSLTGGCDAILGLKKATLFDPDAGSSSVTTTGGTGGAGGTSGTGTTSSTGVGGTGGEGGACVPNATTPCYDGPSGTNGVGACHGGMHVCAEDGMTFGPCVGEQTPAVETCGGAVDINCDGFFCGDTVWAHELATVGNDAGGSVGVDAAGNVYVAGTFSGPMAIGGASLIGFGGRDIFVAKFEPKGKLLWAKQFGDVSDETANAMAVDAAGNVVITGSTTEPVNFGGVPVQGLVYVLKLDASGNHVWSTSCGGTNPLMNYGVGGTGIGFDAQGNVVVGGEFAGTMNCGDGPHKSSGGLDIFLTMLSENDGHALWSKAFGDATDQYVYGLSVDSAGNAVIAGTANGLVNFGGMNLFGGGFYMARFSPTGAHNWSRQWGAKNEARPSALVTDSSGGLAMSGIYYAGSFNFGGAAFPAPAQGSSGAFVVRFDGGGNHLWSHGFAEGTGNGIALQADGGVMFAGSSGPGIDVGGGPLANGKGFVAEFTAQGTYLRSKAFGENLQNSVYPSAIALGPAGEVAVVGNYSGTVDFGPGPITSSEPGTSDFFLLKLAP
jgi:hypothetical protein